MLVQLPKLRLLCSLVMCARQGSAVARIFIVDSEPTHGEIAGIGLERRSVVADGSAEIRRFELKPPDLFLAEVLLPTRSACDILNGIAGQPCRLRLPVIFLTARSTNSDMARPLVAGDAD